MPVTKFFQKGADTIRLAHIIFPPGTLKICGIPCTVLGTLSALASFTNILNGFKSVVLIFFAVSIPLSYIISLLINIARLTNRNQTINKKNKKLKKKLKQKSKEITQLKENRTGLKNQLNIYQDEIHTQENIIQKLNFENQHYQFIISLILALVPDNKLPTLEQRMNILEGRELNEKNESSKDNQH